VGNFREETDCRGGKAKVITRGSGPGCFVNKGIMQCLDAAQFFRRDVRCRCGRVFRKAPGKDIYQRYDGEGAE